jgi:hypothetical protein
MRIGRTPIFASVDVNLIVSRPIMGDPLEGRWEFSDEFSIE